MLRVGQNIALHASIIARDSAFLIKTSAFSCYSTSFPPPPTPPPPPPPVCFSYKVTWEMRSDSAFSLWFHDFGADACFVASCYEPRGWLGVKYSQESIMPDLFKGPKPLTGSVIWVDRIFDEVWCHILPHVQKASDGGANVGDDNLWRAHNNRLADEENAEIGSVIRLYSWT